MRSARILLMLLTVGAMPPDVPAQQSGEAPGTIHYNQSGGINLAPRPGSFTVVSVDAYQQTVRIRGRDGRIGDVRVEPGVFDISALKPGAEIQVDFLEPNDSDEHLTAATIWPQQ